MAYYTVPTVYIEDTVDFYEDTLNVFKKNKSPDEMQAILGIASAKTKTKNAQRLLDPNHNKGHNNQFRLVDAEEFVIGIAYIYSFL